MEKDINVIIQLVENSCLDQTVKEILIRDLKKEGLTDFLKEQIQAYCMDGIEKIDKQVVEIDQLLNKNPSV